MFERYLDTPLFLAEKESGACVIAFYLLKDNRGSNTPNPKIICLQESWESCAGYYLFFNIKEIPENRDKFEKAITSFMTAKLGGRKPAHTGFLWLIYDGAIIEKEIDAIETKVKVDETDEENPKVVVTEEKLLDFGGYQLPFGIDSPVVFERDGASYTGFIFQYPPQPLNLCPSGANLPVPSDGVHLTFIGPRRGCFECKCLIGDYYSEEYTSWHVGIRYAVKVGEGLAQQFYPIFDLRDGRRPLLKMCWDLADHLNPDRTFLEFLSKSVKLVPDGSEACKFKLKIPNHPEIVPTYFRTVTGEVIGLAPQRDGAPPARLVFEVWEKKAPPGRSRYYLAPSGKFELVLIDVDEKNDFAFTPITKAKKKAEFPSRFMCGLAGVESVQFMPRDEEEDDESGETTQIPGESIVFFPRKPAYAPAFPVIGLDGVQLQLPDNLDLIQQQYLTSWIGFSSSRGTSAYFSQPEAAPLYTPEDNDPEDQLLTLFEPVAAPLAEASARLCFPVAPLAGATPISGAPEPRVTFLRSFESQIIGPWRREVIRLLFNQVAPDSTGTTEVVAVTPQGLRAKVKVDRKTPQQLGEMVKAEQWGELLLAHPKGTDSILKFSNLDPTLQAAFQSNQLLLVATDGTYFREFASKVKIGVWEFDLDPSKSQNNVIIFKFGPGKLRERLRDPRSWTNPSDFNDTENVALADLATWLSDFIEKVDDIFWDDNENESEDERKKREKKKPDYKPLYTILGDDNWSGILGLDVHINTESLPAELKALSAGIDPAQFAAKYLAIETGTIEYRPRSSVEPLITLEPEECSLFGLIDYDKELEDDETGGPDADFTVTRLRAVFRNGDLTEFTCDAQLKIIELFGYNVKPVKTIYLTGSRERRAGGDAYSLTIAGDQSDPAELDESPAIESVELKKAELQVTEEFDYVTGETYVSVTFSFSGALRFKALDDGAFDIFSYNTLPYSGLIVRMDFEESTPAERSLKVDLTGFSLDGNPAAAVARADSLVKKFPMKLQRFYSSSSANNPTKDSDTAPVKDGYVPVTCDANSDAPLAKLIYGLDFSLNLGTLGEFASNAGINVNLLLAWSTEKQVKVFLKFPGVSGASADLFSLQGVVTFGASKYELVYTADQENNGVKGWMLMLKEMGLRILGVGFPNGPKPTLYIFGSPTAQGQPEPGDNETPLGWYAAYKGVPRP